ncbi:MAG: hypothetical protein ACRENE_29475, partial [Polyangiaceae bacterium]
MKDLYAKMAKVQREIEALGLESYLGKLSARWKKQFKTELPAPIEVLAIALLEHREANSAWLKKELLKISAKYDSKVPLSQEQLAKRPAVEAAIKRDFH